ncbi:ribosome recycling factor family protein [Pseudoalteromonas luteoviolacea]|uniref:Ribosome recycling factor n=1 Tax=Pseudoalteromonas luteoviolacea H33 TaxID=1365251 RepID=A0A161Y9N9_9GAMM|nr:ribosome recycling factor family protein [Pseudoalteromonas luteoviolacea]KZN53004.1 hypothetical protein N476_09470 [Pseudoalteromonas luteoviolacea H33]KZN78079.1 hypothetical protein N477_10595 [Pseudoalteromonas luteoviolacea H33-S]MBQ4875709.1 hypothetical protein [Pseudoalteromonas luteoviolacea]MBQ4904744.1 hypothetical protein [Pseudoalteromonas luteoviolacea]
MFDIQLNSFVRRVNHASELKSIIKATGAQLNRKGRSRNWRLQGNWSQCELIIQSIQQQDEPSWHWVLEVLNKLKPKPSIADLVDEINANPNITLQQLMIKTDCSLIEARKAFDLVAWE